MSYYKAEASFDWISYVDDRGGVRAIRGRKDEYLMTCPSCQKPKLAVNVRRRMWRCFSCDDAGRDATSLVAKVDDLMWHEAMAVVLDGTQRPIGRLDQIDALMADDAARPPSWIPQARPWPDSFEPLQFPLTPMAQTALNYCHSRGIPQYVIHGMGLGVCSMGRFRGRVIFPVFDSGDRLIFYQGRATWQPRARERHIKTLSPRTDVEAGQAGAGDVLLNVAYVAAKGAERVAVVEGPVDCAHAWPDAVCTFGKHISARQIELLMRAGIREIDLCFDSDAMDVMIKVAPALASIFTVRIVNLPDGKDPGDLTKEQIDHYRVGASIWGSGARLNHIP